MTSLPVLLLRGGKIRSLGPGIFIKRESAPPVSPAPQFEASVQRSAFLMVQLSHPCMTTAKTIALTIWVFISKMMSLLFNMLSRIVIGRTDAEAEAPRRS